MIKELQDLTAGNKNEIAVIGMAGKFPKAADLKQFWRNLINGINCIDDFPGTRRKEWREICAQSLYARLLSKYSPEQYSNDDNVFVKGGYLDEVDKFDAAFFRISPKEAMYMDPLQRVFLEVAYEAMEDAGYGGQKLYGAKVGVFVGKDHTNPTMYRYITEPDEMQLTGSWTGILASRISYIFNFRSPCMVIDTACSSGLVALYEACRALNNKECDLAIAGGVQVHLFTEIKGESSMQMVESSDDHVRTFDKAASGTIWGEGAGALILKPLEKAIADRDHIHAVIKGCAVNNDGASSGISAPNAEAQKELIIKAWKEAKIDPETISYIEAHGTGTNLGDPIEIKGITAAFEEFTTKKQFCGIGSVKTNVGHLVAAAGLASVIKVILALKNKEIPPSINFHSPNPYINFLNSPVYVNDYCRPWNSTDGSPRRAGVSAFGFSGTNCHVILEEAPALAGPETILPQNQPGILTISARNKHTIQELLKRYDEFLEHTPKADLGNICFTANTGRGHYNFRIVLVVTNMQDLKQKIAKLKVADPEEVREPGIYYGSYKIVPDNKKDHAENELTENERRQLNTTANQKLKEYLSTQSDTRVSTEFVEKFTAELCQLYIKGADIAWDELYQDRGFTKVSLPVYPLERLRCWAPPNITRIEGLPIDSKPIHPLLHKLLADSLDLRIYVTEFTVDNHWVLNEHRVLNYYIAPGTTYLEMARAAGEAYYDDSAIELRDFMFINPLVVEPGEKKEVQTIVKKESEYLDFTVASKTVNSFGDEQWAIHARGKIYRVRSGEAGRYDLAELKAKLDRNRINVSESIGNKNFTFGLRWNNIVFGAGENDRALLQLQLPDEFKDDLHDYGIHPALMDQAVDAFSQGIGGMRLPLMYKRMTIYGRMPASFYCYMRRKDQGGGNLETVLLDATLIDESGQVFIEIEDYSLKRVKDGELKFKKATDEIFYYGFTWLPEELKMDAPPTGNGSILVFKDERGIADQIIQGLKTKGWDLIEVETGSGFEQITEHKFRLKGEEADYQKLVAALKGKKIAQIVHLRSIVKESGRTESIAELEEKQSKGLYSLFYLSRALAGFNCQDGIDLILIADNVNEVTKAEDGINPASAAFFGLGKTVFYENEKLRCRAIDIDHHTAPDKIVAEILAPSPAYQVAYRHNQRFIEEFQIVEPQNEPGQAIKDGARMRANGVYIITGGTGGLGLEIGKYLAGKAKPTLALINRTAMPGRESWDEVLTRNEDQKLGAKIRAIREMEQTGAEVLIFNADVSSESSLKPVLDELRQKCGQINGVIHAAGTAGAGFMNKKDIQTFKNVITPKIQGTWLLDKLTGADDLDFFIMFSSIVTITGGAGQSDYTAANSYLDSFAAYRNKQGKKTISINWPLWEEVGMAADYGVTDQNLIFKAVARDKALGIFEEILARVSARDTKCCSRVICGELNYQMITAVSGDLPFKLSERINAAIQKQKIQLTRNKAASKERTFPKAAVIGISSRDEEQTAYILAQIWARVLGLVEIDVNQNFYDMGGDSILAGQLFNEINHEYPEVINISDIFTYPSIVELSKYIDEKGGFEHSGKPDSMEPADLDIQPLPLKEFYPMSSAQKRMFILHQIEGGNLSYNMPFVLLVEGKLDRQRVEEAFRKLIQRQESLRTTFDTVAGEPVQRIHQTVEFQMEYWDGEDGRDSFVHDHSIQDSISKIITEFIQPFDLSRAPLLRVGLFKISDIKHVLMYDLHHIVSDGFSMGILLNEFIDLYEGKSLPEPRIRYKDFAAWQNEVFRSEKIKPQEEYWLQIFSGELPLLNLPLDYPRPAFQSFEGDRVEFEIGPELTERISQIAVENGATLYMVLLAAFNVLLFKYTGQDDIIIGSPVAGRSHTGLEKIIGVFINTLAMRNYPAGDKTFQEFLAEVKENFLKAFDNQEYQFETMIEKLNLRRDLSRTPLFEVMFVLQNIGIDARESMGLRFTPLTFTNKTAKFDLTLEAFERGDQKILFGLEYCTRLFQRETIVRLTRHFVNILTVVTANPAIQLKGMEFLSAEEKEQILKGFNNTKAEYLKGKLVHELFEEQAAQTPTRIALQFKDETLTYRELNEQANRLAGVLRGHGVKPNNPVAIMVNRSLEMIIGIMAILKAGGAYLPIDPEYPGERIKYMLEDSETGILLTQDELNSKAEFRGIVLDLNDRRVFQKGAVELAKVNTARDLAYIIYTSGSTGQPKGVMIEHRAVHNFIRGITERIDFTAGKTILALTTISFDIFGLETLLALAGGLKIVIASEQEQLNPMLLSEVIIQNRIEMLQITPSRLQLLLSDEHYRSCFENLTEIMIGGEALPESLLGEVRKLTRAKIYNMYGPTETTIWSTVKDLTADTAKTAVNIGTPIANTQIYIVDPNNRPQPVGVAGELCIAGDGLARGYWKQPELTAEKFIFNPFHDDYKLQITDSKLNQLNSENFNLQSGILNLKSNRRMYRTGDLAKWLPDGNIEFLGRIDYQVKIRGYRIELGEIEVQLLKYEAVKEAVVVAGEDGKGNKYLCAYLSGDRELTVQELRAYLSGVLPEYMVPSYFSQLFKLPLTPNGKIDRKALLEPDGAMSTGVEYVAPQNDIEMRLAEIWREVLGIEKVGVNDNFFDLGGDSLRSIRVASQAHNIGLQITPREIWEHSTIAELAQIHGEALTDPNMNIKQEAFDKDQELTGSVSVTPNQNQSTKVLIDITPQKIGELAAGFLCGEECVISYASSIGRDYQLMFNHSGWFDYDPFKGPFGSYLGKLSERVRVGLGQGLLDYSRPLADGHGIILTTKFHTSAKALQVIKNQLRNQKPVIVILDSYWIPWDPKFKREHSKGHNLLIVGMDTELNHFIGVDPYFMLKNCILPFKYFLKGYKRILLMDVTPEKEPDYLQILKDAALNMLHDPKGKNHFNSMREFSKDLERLLDIKKEIRGCQEFSDSLLYATFASIAARRNLFPVSLSYIASKLGYAENAIMKIAARVGSAAEKWSIIKGLIGKLFVLDQPESIIRIIANKIKQVADEEEGIAKDLLSIAEGNTDIQAMVIIPSSMPDIRPAEAENQEIIYLDLTKFLNNKAFGRVISNSYVADFSGTGHYLLAQGLPENDIWQFRDHGDNGQFQFKFPMIDGSFDNVYCLGQNLLIPEGNYSSILILGCSEYGSFREYLTVHCVSGKSYQVPVAFTDYWNEAPQFGETVAWTGKNVYKKKVGEPYLNPRPHYLYAKKIYLNHQEPISKISLPELPNIHIFAISLVKLLTK
jgi:amino acid adenylation domain-containing protein